MGFSCFFNALLLSLLTIHIKCSYTLFSYSNCWGFDAIGNIDIACTEAAFSPNFILAHKNGNIFCLNCFWVEIFSGDGFYLGDSYSVRNFNFTETNIFCLVFFKILRVFYFSYLPYLVTAEGKKILFQFFKNHLEEQCLRKNGWYVWYIWTNSSTEISS